MAIIFCKNCKIEINEHAKGMCVTCYKKLIWKPKKVECKRCKRMLPMHAKGLCNGCYNSIFHIENVKMHNTRRYHNIDYEAYKSITRECVVCGFNKVVDLHHIDMNHKNNSKDNLTGLCPNHHKMAHHREHQKEVFEALISKGFTVPEGFKDDNLFK